MNSAVKKAVAAAVVDAVKVAVASPATDAKAGDTPIIARAVIDQVTPLVVNATNNEPWYQSRVTLGAIASIALPVLGALGVSTDLIDSDQLVAFLMALGTVAGGILTLYGRWKAKKPLGS